MEKLHLKRVQLNFETDSETINISEIIKDLKSEYQDCTISIDENLNTIIDKYLILAFVIKDKKQVKVY